MVRFVEEWEPMVTHGSVMKGYHVKVTGSVSFDDCLKFIADNGWKDTDDPLFLMIENVTDSAAETGNRVDPVPQPHVHVVGGRGGGWRSPKTGVVPSPPHCISHVLVQATVGVGTVIILYVI